MTKEEMKQLASTVLVLEKGCTAMYELVMKHNEQLEALHKKISELENEKNNSR